MKRLSGLQGYAIEVARAKDERTGRVPESAGAFPPRHGLEHARIGAGLANVAGSGFFAAWRAGEATEDRPSAPRRIFAVRPGGK